MNPLELKLNPTIKDALTNRRRKLLLSMYAIAAFTFLLIFLQDVFFGIYHRFFIKLFPLILISLSFYFCYVKKNYEIASHSIVFIVGVSILYLMVLNDFEHLTPFYVIPFSMSTIFLYSWKKGLQINFMYFFFILLCIILLNNNLLKNLFILNEFSSLNFFIILTVVILLTYLYEITRVDAYKVLLELSQKQDMLFREINHRVKNNLNIVSSMLSMQAESQSQEVQNIIHTSKNRIESIALVHSMLYSHNSIENVDAQEFIQKLSKNITSTCEKNIELVLSIDKIQLPLNQIIPIGLIINELLTNSIKHSFKKLSNPKAIIVLHVRKNNILLTYFDNGKGFSSKKQNLHLGLTLINLNVKQLKAIMKTKQHNRLQYNIKFQRKENV
jgi:two-component sensor histidine kinase